MMMSPNLYDVLPRQQMKEKEEAERLALREAIEGGDDVAVTIRMLKTSIKI